MVPTAIREYVRPMSVDDVWAMLAERGKAAQVIGGGIDAHLYAVPDVSMLIDLTALGLSYVRGEEELAIGATTTFAEILEAKPARAYLGGVLVDVLEQVASPLQRNLGTIGGTIGSAHPWSDVIPLLLALGAELNVHDGRDRSIPLTQYLADRASCGRPLITEVRLPAPLPQSACAFEAFTTTGFDVAILNCACFVALDAGRCGPVRIAVGGTPALASRVSALEEAVTGTALDGATIDRVASLATDAIDVRDDRRATADHRRVLARIGVARCLRRVAGELGGTG